jgi:recombinational DNA repair ATPase RecF
MLKTKQIIISGIGPIKDLKLDFNDHFNIICGQNGIGKTTILDCLAQSFSVNQISVKRNARIVKGSWDINVDIDNKTERRTFEINSFHPHEGIRGLSMQGTHGFYQNSNDVIVFKTHRDIKYRKLIFS